MTRQFDPYKSLRTTEPNIRTEFLNTMNGVFPEIAKAQTLVHRKMKTDNNGEFISCPCVSDLTGEPDKDYWCPICNGEGLLWEESLVDGYKVILGGDQGQAGKEQLISPGNINLVYISFYFKYNLEPNIIANKKSPDRIIELMTDAEGDPIIPYQRKAIYKIGTAIDYRSDYGKLEYWKLNCTEVQFKFLNGPEG